GLDVRHDRPAPPPLSIGERVPPRPPSVVSLRGEQRRSVRGRPGRAPGLRLRPPRASLPPPLALRPLRQRGSMDGPGAAGLARIPAHRLPVHGRPRRLRPLGTADGAGPVHRHPGRPHASRTRADCHPVPRPRHGAAAGRGGFGPLVGLEMLFGVLWALDFPARRTALYALVGPRRVATAVSLETVSMQVAKMVGPVLAGIELARLGPAPCYVGVAVLYVVGILVFAGLPARIGGPGRRDTISMAASLGAGFREAWRQPTVRAVLIVTVMMNVLFFPYQHMLPVFAREVLRVGPEWLGALVAADGLGALLGALAIAGRRGFL